MTNEIDSLEQELRSLVGSSDRKKLRAFVERGREVSPVVLRGLRDPDWRVRRDCLRFIDHHADPDSARAALDLLASDSEPEVRKWAAHALGCGHCKSGSTLGFDPVPALIAAARSDASLRVRRSAVVSLAWGQPADARIHEFLGELASGARDAKIRRHAADGAARHASRLDATE